MLSPWHIFDGVFKMTVDRAVLAFAVVSPLFIWFTVFIGLNMFQSAFTGLCPAAMIFRKLGLRDGAAPRAA